MREGHNLCQSPDSFSLHLSQNTEHDTRGWQGWLTLVLPQSSSTQAFLLAFLLLREMRQQVWSGKWSFSQSFRVLLDFIEHKTLNITQGTDKGDWHLSLVTWHRLVSCNNPVSLSLSLSLVSVELVTICASLLSPGRPGSAGHGTAAALAMAVSGSGVGDTQIRSDVKTGQLVTFLPLKPFLSMFFLSSYERGKAKVLITTLSRKRERVTADGLLLKVRCSGLNIDENGDVETLRQWLTADTRAVTGSGLGLRCLWPQLYVLPDSTI